MLASPSIGPSSGPHRADAHAMLDGPWPRTSIGSLPLLWLLLKLPEDLAMSSAVLWSRTSMGLLMLSPPKLPEDLAMSSAVSSP